MARSLCGLRPQAQAVMVSIGGGVTMAISLPATPEPTPAYPGEPARRERDEARPNPGWAPKGDAVAPR
jgi:hypothetical protein